MSNSRMTGKKIVVTQADEYMGPATIDLFRREGGTVIADTRDLTVAGAADMLISEVGQVDILIANLACRIDPYVPADQMADSGWHHMFDMIVHPLHRLCRAVLPQMYARRHGKIVVYGSATGIRLVEGVSAYSAARSAQVGYVRAIGGEAVRHNVQINLIAQHFTANPTYFPKEFLETEQFSKMLAECPSGRLATGEEDALLALFLASSESNFIVGETIPFTGGWHL